MQPISVPSYFPENLKISLITWNCGNVVPTIENRDLAFMAEALEINTTNTTNEPDIVVIGLQESMEASSGAKFIGKRFEDYLQKVLRKNYFEVKSSAPNSPEAIRAFPGLTKVTEGYCYQQLAVFIKLKQNSDNSIENGSCKEVFYCQYQYLESGATSIKTYVRNAIKNKISGKGGIISIIKYQEVYLAFITAHLDSFKEDKRTIQIKEIMSILNDFEIKNRKLAAAFFMGDLNYRLNANFPVSIVNSKSPLLKPIKEIKLDEYLKNKTTLMNWISNPILKEKLLLADGINNSDLVKKYKFLFPKFLDFLPTYYNNVSIPEARFKISVNKMSRDDYKENFFTSFYIDKLFDSKENHELKAFQKRKGEFNAGWLDRIGFKSLTPFSIKILKSADIPKLNVSDHIPVILTVNLNSKSYSSLDAQKNSKLYIPENSDKKIVITEDFEEKALAANELNAPKHSVDTKPILGSVNRPIRMQPIFGSTPRKL